MHNNATENVTNKFLRIPQGGALQYVYKQAGAELGQAQLKLELGFTSPVALNL